MAVHLPVLQAQHGDPLEDRGVEGKNGLEVHAQICNIVDAVSLNFKFFIDSQFTTMPQAYVDKINGLNELCAHRPML